MKNSSRRWGWTVTAGTGLHRDAQGGASDLGPAIAPDILGPNGSPIFPEGNGLLPP